MMQLYLSAESLKHLATTLPEKDAGFGLLLMMLSAEIRVCAEVFDQAS